MTYKIEQIEGIAPQFAERLSVAGVNDSDDLLKRCATEEGRRQLAAHAGLSTEQLETWMHQADLMRVSGIGSEFGRLLETSGVQSVTELRDRKPENVVNLLHRVNGEKKLTRALPSLKTVSKWINRARELQPFARPRDVSRADSMKEPMHASMSASMDAKMDAPMGGVAPTARPHPTPGVGHTGPSTGGPGEGDLPRREFAGDSPAGTRRPW